MADDFGLTPEHRARLAHKARILYGKSCGTGGSGTCLEGFALHQIRNGHAVVARDLLAFLENQIETLAGSTPRAGW